MTQSNRAMVLRRAGAPLEMERRDVPEPEANQVLVRVAACGVCRTDLHVVDGDLTQPRLPLVPGHEIVGTIAARGRAVERFAEGARVGIPWLGWTCGACRFCVAGKENLCEAAKFTGYTLDGGYGDYALADQRYVFPIEGSYSDAEAAPLLCAGLIGYRSLVMAGEAERIGLYGFRGAGFSPSPGRATKRRSNLRWNWARSGPAIRARRRRRNWMPRSSTPPSAPWCRRPCARSPPAAPWSAPGFT
jgi:propanol-preferring alcohol dehydrogenase